MRKRIAIFGGTFDPLHRGHLEGLDQICQKFSFHKIWIVPAKFSREKTPAAPYEKRLEWVKKCFVHSVYAVSELEKNVSQTIFGKDIHSELRLLDPEADYYWILGQDQFEQLAYWKAIDDYAGQLHWLVMSRSGGAAFANERPGLFSKRLLASSCSYEWVSLPSELQSISSRALRAFLTEESEQLEKEAIHWIPSAIREDVKDFYRHEAKQS